MADYTVNEAATLLGLSPKSVRVFIGRGMIAATKRGRDWFITAEAIEHYLQERRPVGRPPRPPIQEGIIILPHDSTDVELAQAREEIRAHFSTRRHIKPRRS